MGVELNAEKARKYLREEDGGFLIEAYYQRDQASSVTRRAWSDLTASSKKGYSTQI